jgi:tetratricopeptide (TPR) repeat protein
MIAAYLREKVFMDKKTEKQLKRPDAFQKFFFHAMAWLRSQEKALIMVLIPLALLLVVGGAWQYYRYWESGQRKHQLAEIEKSFAKEEKEAAKKRSAIQDAITQMEKPSKNKDVKAEDNKALIENKRKEMESIEADHKDTVAKYIAFFHANEKNAEGWRAGMVAVETLVKTEKLQEASDIVSKILAHSLGIPFYQVQVRLMYVGILEDLKKYDAALTELEKVIPLAPEDLLPKVYLNRSRIELGAGKKEDAVKTLDMIVSKYANSSEARQALAIKAL